MVPNDFAPTHSTARRHSPPSPPPFPIHRLTLHVLGEINLTRYFTPHVIYVVLEMHFLSLSLSLSLSAPSFLFFFLLEDM